MFCFDYATRKSSKVYLTKPVGETAWQRPNMGVACSLQVKVPKHLWRQNLNDKPVMRVNRIFSRPGSIKSSIPNFKIKTFTVLTDPLYGRKSDRKKYRKKTKIKWWHICSSCLFIIKVPTCLRYKVSPVISLGVLEPRNIITNKNNNIYTSFIGMSATVPREAKSLK